MTTSTRLHLLAGAALLVLSVPSAGIAADVASDPGASQVGEVVVTANKRQERLIDVAQSVSVISGAALDLQQAAHFGGLRHADPGFQPGLPAAG